MLRHGDLPAVRVACRGSRVGCRRRQEARRFTSAAGAAAYAGLASASAQPATALLRHGQARHRVIIDSSSSPSAGLFTKPASATTPTPSGKVTALVAKVQHCKLHPVATCGDHDVETSRQTANKSCLICRRDSSSVRPPYRTCSIIFLTSRPRPTSQRNSSCLV